MMGRGLARGEVARVPLALPLKGAWVLGFKAGAAVVDFGAKRAVDEGVRRSFLCLPGKLPWPTT